MTRPRPFWLIAGALLAVLPVPRALACGWWSAPLFYLRGTPSVPAEQFLAGELGIISPEWDTASLLVAFRYLENLPLDATTRAAFLPFWEPRLDADAQLASGGTDLWQDTVEKATGTRGRWITRERDLHDEAGNYTGFYSNCLNDAFVTAARTLDGRVERYGKGSREVEEWLSGQNAVFANCYEGMTEPAELDESWDERLRADRAYQRAAAAFYSERFDLATERFRAVAADGRSEWSTVARYLVARSRVRARDIDGALAELEAIRSDARLAAYHAAGERLRALVLTNWRPADRERELAAVLFGSSAAPSLRQALHDYTKVLGSDSTKPDARSRELAAWVSSLRAKEPGLTFERFREKRSLAWLIAALFHPAPDEATSEQVLTAARAVPVSSPAFLTVRAALATRLVALGRLDEARTTLDGLLALGENDLTASDRNWLRDQRSHLARDFAEYFTLRTQVPIGETDGYTEWLSKDEAAALNEENEEFPQLSLQAVNVLDLFTPLEELSRLQQSDVFPERWRLPLALMGFARAEVAGDLALAETFAAEIARRDEDATVELETWKRETDSEKRRFLATLFLLRRPGAALDVEQDVGDGEAEGFAFDTGRWWCAARPPLSGYLDTGQDLDATAWPAFLGPEPKLARPETESAPILLGHRVLAYADAHRDDPDVPEALHRVVRATRYGCRDVRYGEISKAAFDRLHRRYPKSEWTSATPYWFD